MIIASHGVTYNLIVFLVIGLPVIIGGGWYFREILRGPPGSVGRPGRDG